MGMECSHDHMIGQQRGIGQGKTTPCPGRSPSDVDDSARKIQIDPPALLVPVRRVVDLGVRPRFEERLEDIRVPQKLGSGGRSCWSSHVLSSSYSFHASEPPPTDYHNASHDGLT